MKNTEKKEKNKKEKAVEEKIAEETITEDTEEKEELSGEDLKETKSKTGDPEDVNAEEANEEEKEESDGEDKKKDPRDEKIAELNDKVMRQMAEFDNFRKRTEKEKEQMFEVGAKSIIEKILPIIDNFERALEMAGSDENEQQDPFMDGMEKVYRQLMDELEKAGVTPIVALGEDFNPDYHNAVMQEASEEFESGKVIKELQKGYMYRESVVRHSMVSVAE